MAEIRVIKIGTEGHRENENSDTTRFDGHTIVSGGAGLVFDDPASDGIKPTAATITADNLLSKDRDNTFVTAAGINFPTVTDAAGEVDIFQLPTIAGTPTATPTLTGEGFMLWDSTGGAPYIWDGAAWDNIGIADEAETVCNQQYSAESAVVTGNAVYVASNLVVNQTIASGTASRVIGFAGGSATTGAAVKICSEGYLPYFSDLTVGSPYYLDPGTSGAITSVLPTASADVVYFVGYAVETNAVHAQLTRVGRRT